MVKVVSAVSPVQTPVAVNLGEVTQVVVAASVVVPLSSVIVRVSTPTTPLAETVILSPAFNWKVSVLTALTELSLMT